MKTMRPLLLLLAGLTVIGGTTGVRAEDSTALPRTYLSAGALDIVLIAAPGSLYAFVDRKADNTPAALGTLTVGAGKKQWTLTERAPGLYQAADVVLGSGHIPLVVTVAGDGFSQQLETALDIQGTVSAAPLRRPHWQWWLIIAVAGLATAGIAWSIRGKLSRWFGFAS